MSSTIVADSKAKMITQRQRIKKEEKKSALSIITDPVKNKINKEQRKELLEQLKKR